MEERYMTISKLMEYNLFNTEDSILVNRNTNILSTLLRQCPTAAILRQNLN